MEMVSVAALTFLEKSAEHLHSLSHVPGVGQLWGSARRSSRQSPDSDPGRLHPPVASHPPTTHFKLLT